MEIAYRADAWQAMYATVAAASATLIGLLFVALSLDLPAILRNPAYLARAREVRGGLLSLLILSVLVLTPGQDRRVLGAELIVGVSVLAAIGGAAQFQTLRRVSVGRRRWALRLVPLHLGTATALIAGASLAFGWYGGLYWLVPAVLLYLLWSVNNAWVLVVQVNATGAGPPSSSPPPGVT